MRCGHYIIGGIVIIAFLMATMYGIFWFSLSDLAQPLDRNPLGHQYAIGTFSGQALSLLRTGTLNYNEIGYPRLTQRGPVYSFALAIAFFVLGERLWSIVFVNFFFLALAVIFLWFISRRFLSGGWEFFPSLALALFWQPSSLVWLANYEMFSLFLATFFFTAFFAYNDTKNAWWLLAAAIGLGVWALERPVVLYFSIILTGYLIYWNHHFSWRRIAAHMAVWVFITGSIIGAWSLRNYSVLDTWQLGAGGPVLLRRASHVDFSFKEVVSMALSFTVGDFIGSRIYAHYPEDAEPKTWDPSIEDRWYQKGWWITEPDGSVISRVEFDKKTYQEALDKIKARPIKFFFTGFINLFRLNGPINYNGLEMMHLFVNTHNNLSSAMKMSIILLIRGLWYGFLGITFFAAITHMKDWRTWGVLALAMLYYNGMYAFFTHAEPRYLLTVMPFYFIFFAEGIRLLYYGKIIRN